MVCADSDAADWLKGKDDKLEESMADK